tara:strand:- start:2256 stop:4316 length:2061 start_codon:yes stop_codon:yes gene_type:complete
MTNRLINESSPYLQQHAQNPVEWYPWGEEALNKAIAEGKPMLLSIGYSACHWCHVMERESFEDRDVAAIMNKWFVNIKVDREERPDLDSIYMLAVQSMTGSGGWPLTVFLTSDGKPFFGGTYFPPTDRHGLPSFTKVLTTIGELYHQEPEKVAENAEQVINHLQKILSSGANSEKTQVHDSQIHQAIQGLKNSFDWEHGGLGTAPKFPQPLVHEFMLQYADRFKDEDALNMVLQSLDAMSAGGIYDQIGGGFHRYSTDRSWLVPHFEKMLYDNALLSSLYLNAYRITGLLQYEKVVTETLDYVIREMISDNGGFFAAQDADSEGVEGKYFVWTSDEIICELGRSDGEILCQYFGVIDGGNFEGNSILHKVTTENELAAIHNMTIVKLREILDKGKMHLLNIRYQRIPPACDDKIIVAWNGFMMRAFAEAGSVLQSSQYTNVALRNAEFLLENLSDDGILCRVITEGSPKGEGYLEDYASLIDGLLAVYRCTLNLEWLTQADALAQTMIRLFWDEESKSFYDTGINHEKLVVRPRDYFDNAVPCGTSLAVNALLQLGSMTLSKRYREIADTVLSGKNTFAANNPFAMSNLLRGLDFHLAPPSEIVLVGSNRQLDESALLYGCHKRYMPNTVIAGGDPSHPAYATFPLMEDKSLVGNEVTAYICRDYTCGPPITELNELESYLTLREK